MIHYDSWHVPTTNDFHLEWESEWDKMRYFLDTSFFDDEDRFVEFMVNPANYRVVRLPKDVDNKIRRRTHCRSIAELELTVASYRSAARRKGVPTRLGEMMTDGSPLPMPFITKRQNYLTVAGGNTRLDVARILDIDPAPRVLFYDLDAPNAAHLLAQYPLSRKPELF